MRTWLLTILAIFVPAFAFGQGEGLLGHGIPLIVPGSALAWEIDELRVVLKVERAGEIEVRLYSPGFDPKDYRSPNELGDERYDRGEGKLFAVYELRASDRVIARRTYGVEPHQWHTLYKGHLEAGEYVIAARFYGNGKNAVVFDLNVHSGKAHLQIAPDSLQTYNVVRDGWQTPFTLNVSEFSKDLKVGIYDGDGPRELKIKATTPQGELYPEVPGNRAWSYIPTERPGRYAFSFRIPETATQYTNTVGFQLFLGKIHVEIVDVEGRPVPGAHYRLTGEYRRVVELRAPPGWELVKTEVEGGRKLSPQKVLFGLGSGRVRFVLKRTAPMGTLAISAKVRCGDYTVPLAAKVRINEKEYLIPKTGELRIALPQGVYSLEAEVPGAIFEGDARVSVVPGRETKAQLFFKPIITTALNLSATRVIQGEEIEVTARASTRFPKTLPIRLQLALPPGLTSLGPTEIQAPLSSKRDVVLKVPVRAERSGAYEIQAFTEPCHSEAKASVEVITGPRFAIKKEAIPDKAAIGETVRFVITVSNHGDAPGRVRVLDQLPPGLKGDSLDERLELKPGEEWQKEIKALVTEEAGANLQNKATLLDGNRRLAEAQAFVEVLRPAVELSCVLDKAQVLPGETAHVCAAVENTGEAPLKYEVSVSMPDWVEPSADAKFGGVLKPQEKTEHCVDGLVKFGQEAKGRIVVNLRGNAGEHSAECVIERTLLKLTKTVTPSRILLGDEVTYTIKVENPLPREVAVKLLDLPVQGLGIERYEQEVSVPAGGEYSFRRKAKPIQLGKLKNQASVYLGGVPAAMPAKALVEVLPPLRAFRTSTVELPFKVEAQGDALLIRHAPPEAARYRVGSSRLDGKPIPDPRVDREGRLYWKLPFTPEGVLSYELEHEHALPKLPEPELTLLIDDRDVPIKGELRLKDYEQAKPIPVTDRKGLIRMPAPGTVIRDRDSIHVQLVAPYGVSVELRVNGEAVSSEKLGEARYDRGQGLQTLDYYAVKLKPGKNVIEAQAGSNYDRIEVFLAGAPERLVLIPERVVADGRTPLKFRIEEQDALGIPVGRGFVTLEAQPEPMDPDAAPMLSGYQVAMQDGVAKVRLEPMPTPGWVKIKASKDELFVEKKVYVRGPKESLFLAQGSITLRLGQSGLEWGGLARGYTESSFAGGYLQAAMDYVARDASLHPNLSYQMDATQRFPLVGSATEAKFPLYSEDGVAFRYDRGPFTLGYGRFGIFGGLPKASVFSAEYRGPVRIRGFVGLFPSKTVEETIVPLGTRVYQLSHPARPGSEEVYLERGGTRVLLEPFRDYTLDYATGTLYLSYPLWPSDTDFVPQRLVITYAPEESPRDRVGGGLSASYSWKGFTLEASAATLQNHWKYEAKLSYREKGFGAALDYTYAEKRSKLGVSAYGRYKGFSINANLHYAGQLAGRARVVADLSSRSRAVLEHSGKMDRNQTSLLYEQRLTPNLFAGLGAGYLWEEHSFAALGRAGYRVRGFSLALTHTQPFSALPETVLSSSYTIDKNLKLRSDLSYRWGVGLSGLLGLEQKLGVANLSLTYQLPGASGVGNRARFGIRAPWPLTSKWTLDLSATYERALSTGEYLAGAGVGLRYTDQDLRASAGVEGSTGTKGNRLSLRAGVAGQLDEHQVVSADATYQIAPELKGRFSVAYAYRGQTLQFLTYHRYATGVNAAFEGEAALGWHPSLAFQLRPSFAYRVLVSDPDSATFQIGIGANYYVTSRIGFGMGGYYIVQPRLSTSHLAFWREACEYWIRSG